MGLLYGFLFLVIVMNFDTSIHSLCLKIGFEIESSRKYKFYLFFLCIALQVPLTIYYNQQIAEWISPVYWLDNSSSTESNCIS